MMLRKKWKVAATAALAACSVSTAFAGGADTAGWTNPHPLLFPTAASLFAPVGFGTDLGTVFGSFGWVNRWPGTTKDDGNILLGAGLGNGDKYVGFQITGLIDSVGFHDSSFGNSGSFGLKAFRWLTPNFSIALGASNVGGWGALAHNAATSYYGSMTEYFSFFDNGRFPMAATFGFGTGGYFSTTAFKNSSDNEIKPFGSLAVSLMPQVSVIADYTTDLWSAGVSVIPYLPIPIAVTGYATNLGGGAKANGPVTYGVRASFGYTFA